MKCVHCGTIDERGPHTPENCRDAIAYQRDALQRTVERLIPSARLVWEQGGYSGSSGNWALVAAYDELEKLKETAPDVYVRLTEKLK